MLFFGNRRHIRPFVYLKSADVLPTTKSDLQWMDEDERVMDIYGVCIVALLLCTNYAVHFEAEDDIANFLHKDRKFPQTGFIDALRSTDIDLSHAKLKCASASFESQTKTVKATVYDAGSSDGQIYLQSLAKASVEKSKIQHITIGGLYLFYTLFEKYQHVHSNCLELSTYLDCIQQTLPNLDELLSLSLPTEFPNQTK